jgi:hypothetical protein
VGEAYTLNPEAPTPELQGGILRGLMRGGSPNGREREENLDGAYVKLATQVVTLGRNPGKDVPQSNSNYFKDWGRERAPFFNFLARAATVPCCLLGASSMQPFITLSSSFAPEIRARASDLLEALITDLGSPPCFFHWAVVRHRLEAREGRPRSLQHA